MPKTTLKLGAALVMLFAFALPVTGDGGRQVVRLEKVSFLDTSAPVCDVGDALGPGAVPDCTGAEVDLCTDIGCPLFQVVDKGPISGDIDGEINVCINLQSPPDLNLFIPVNGCVQIVTDETTYAGPFTASFNLTHGAFGDYFVRSPEGATLRATFTQHSVPGDPPLFFNTGTLAHPPRSGGDDDDDDDDDDD